MLFKVNIRECMITAIKELLDILQLEKVEENHFVGKNQDLGLPQVFGGQIIAHALQAAMQMVQDDREVHSCHCYFLQPAEVSLPLSFKTITLREGNSFTVIEVSIYQKEQLIAKLTASFHIAEVGFEHQLKMPESDMTEFTSENTLLKSIAKLLPSPIKEKLLAERPFDIRIKYVNDPFQGKVLPPEQYVWAKTTEEIVLTPRQQQCLFAYFSDFHCILTMLHPHQKGFMQPDLKFATLDHSIWFHRQADFNQWHLFSLNSPNAFGGRGLTRGEVFNQSGRFIMSYQQEGLIRQRD